MMSATATLKHSDFRALVQDVEALTACIEAALRDKEEEVEKTVDSTDTDALSKRVKELESAVYIEISRIWDNPLMISPSRGYSSELEARKVWRNAIDCTKAVLEQHECGTYDGSLDNELEEKIKAFARVWCPYNLWGERGETSSDLHSHREAGSGPGMDGGSTVDGTASLTERATANAGNENKEVEMLEGEHKSGHEGVDGFAEDVHTKD